MFKNAFNSLPPGEFESRFNTNPQIAAIKAVIGNEIKKSNNGIFPEVLLAEALPNLALNALRGKMAKREAPTKGPKKR